MDTDARNWLGDLADTREKAIALLPSKFNEPDGAYSYYVSQGFGYRLAEPATQTGKTAYASEQEREEKNFYVSLILPKDGPGYVEHWMTCKRRADNMVRRGEVKGTVYSRKKGLKLLEAHNRKFKDVPPK